MARRWVERDLRAEREDTAEAAELRGVEPEAVVGLTTFAEQRAHPGPVDLGDAENPRDLIREALEELADCRNYLCWRLQALREAGASRWQMHQTRLALAAVALAWRATKRLA